MKAVINRVLVTSTASLVAVFLVVLLVVNMEYALLIAPMVALIVGIEVLFYSYDKYYYNRKAVGRTIERPEFDRWSLNSLVVSIPILALCVAGIVSTYSNGGVPALPQMNFFLFGFASLFAVLFSAIRFTQNTVKGLSQTPVMSNFKTWLDVKA